MIENARIRVQWSCDACGELGAVELRDNAHKNRESKARGECFGQHKEVSPECFVSVIIGQTIRLNGTEGAHKEEDHRVENRLRYNLSIMHNIVE